MQMIELARASGVSPDTVRHYMRMGLIKADQRMGNGCQKFSNRTVVLVPFVRSAVRLGFKLNDVGELLNMGGKGQFPCPNARSVMAQRRHEKPQQVEQEMAFFRHMKQALKAWELMPDEVPEGRHVCSLVEGFEPDESTEMKTRPQRNPLRD